MRKIKNGSDWIKYLLILIVVLLPVLILVLYNIQTTHIDYVDWGASEKTVRDELSFQGYDEFKLFDLPNFLSYETYIYDAEYNVEYIFKNKKLAKMNFYLVDYFENKVQFDNYYKHFLAIMIKDCGPPYKRSIIKNTIKTWYKTNEDIIITVCNPDSMIINITYKPRKFLWLLKLKN